MSDSTALATRDIHSLLESPGVKNELKKALPKHLTPERLLRIAATTIQRSPQLKKCTPISLLACVVETAQLGLEPEGILGESYLVPFKNKKTGTYAATLIVGYKGFMKLVFQTGVVQSINAEIVRKGDSFAITLGTHRSLVHEPKIELREAQKDAEWKGVYATVTYKNGATDFEYFTAAEIGEIRNRSRSKDDGPWVTDTEAMWKKSAIRRLAKRLPKSTTDHLLARAAELDELADAKMLVPTTHGFEIAETAGEDEREAPDVTPIARTEEITVEAEPAKTAGKGKKPAPAPARAPEKPRAQIPKGDVIDLQASTENDPFLSSPEQSDVYNAAAQQGWKVPDEVKEMLQKRFKVDSVRFVRRSQLAKVLQIISSGT